MGLLYQKYVPKNSILLRKLPSKELKTIVKMECAVDNVSIREKELIIQSSKNLRKLLDISEKTVI